MNLNASGIDYLKQSKALINRPGYSYNILSGCRHGCPWCWARKMVETRFKDSPAYPYGFEPTFHPERVRAFGGAPKLIALNFMGDCGGDWEWRLLSHNQEEYQYKAALDAKFMASQVWKFAMFNPDHIILLLTKRPEWYGLVDRWPANVMCGFSASNNEELRKRYDEMPYHIKTYRQWVSCEPWLDDDPPAFSKAYPPGLWICIGGLSGPNARPVSDATRRWLLDDTVQAKRFTKANALPKETNVCNMWIQDRAQAVKHFPREYPESWRVPGVDGE